MSHIYLRTGLVVFAVAAALSGCVNDQQYSPGFAPEVQERALPALTVTNDAPPNVIYRSGSHDTVLPSHGAVFSNSSSPTDTGSSARSIMPLSAQHMETAVTKKADELERELAEVRRSTDDSAQRLHALQDGGDAQLNSYYSTVSSINAYLQTGTTAGNPILVGRWNNAQDKLNAISEDTGAMNKLALDLSDQASKAAFLQESTRAAFALSGAVDEDHRRLTTISDRVGDLVITANRLMGQVNDALNRRAAFLRTERANLQSLSLAIANGEAHGQSLSNSIFKDAIAGTTSSGLGGGGSVFTSHRPLVIIRFDHPNVNYDQPLYTAVSQALEKYPAAKFNLVAVASANGNPAQVSMAANEARKNGEAVLRSLTQMGLPMERINLNAASSREVQNSEVQLYLQ
ncbi:MAG: hypothetical protein HY052_05845 [Proteobacteria bacterium]|nr:hypothetical protein [Pseudomonadota bacterium]